MSKPPYIDRAKLPPQGGLRHPRRRWKTPENMYFAANCPRDNLTAAAQSVIIMVGGNRPREITMRRQSAGRKKLMKRIETNPAHLLPATTATRAARINAAAARHPNTTPAVIIMTAYTASNAAALAAVRESGHAAAHLAIRARHMASGLDFLRRLNLEQSNDRQRESVPEIADRAAAHDRAHDLHRAHADALQAIADRVSTTVEDAATAAAAAAAERAAAARELAAADALHRVISTTSHSDRADISQAATIAMWETGNFALACKTAGKAIGAVAAANGCTATRTKVKAISAADAAAEQQRHPGMDKIPFTIKRTSGSTTQGYYTIEYRDSKQFASGWYKVYHYITIAPVISYETFAATEDAPQLATNGGINAITDQQDAQDLQNLYRRAGLTDRERVICAYMVDNTAAAAGIKAVAEHQQQTAERVQAATSAAQAQRMQRDADRRTEDIRSAAQRDNAMTRAGVYSDRTRRDIMQRIRAKLAAAASSPTQPTAAELAERDRRQWERMQGNRDRYQRISRSAAAAPAIVPTITSTPSAAAPTEYATYTPVWVERVNPADLHTISPAQLAEEQAAAQQHRAAYAAERAALDVRRACRDHEPTRSAYAALDAQSAAYVFIQTMSVAELAEGIRAEQERQQEQQRRNYAAAIAAARQALEDAQQELAAAKSNAAQYYAQEHISAARRALCGLTDYKQFD